VIDLPALPTAEWSICLRDADTGLVLAEYQSEEQLRTASVGKIFLLIEIARQIGAGDLDPAELLERRPEEWVEDSGIWYLLSRKSLTVDDLCFLIGLCSDNLATNALVRRVGIDAVGRTSRALGWTRSELLDRVRPDRGPDDPPTLSRGTGAELSDVMVRLHRGEVVDSRASQRVLRWLAAGADLSMVAAAFDLDPLAHAEPDRGITLVNKTGTISTARIDVGTVTGPDQRVAYAVLANWPDGQDPRDQVLAGMREFGRRIRRAVGG